jgi:hypothetical protein
MFKTVIRIDGWNVLKPREGSRVERKTQSQRAEKENAIVLSGRAKKGKKLSLSWVILIFSLTRSIQDYKKDVYEYQTMKIETGWNSFLTSVDPNSDHVKYSRKIMRDFK